MTTIARDPSGQSRIPVETFKEVFDRMESSIQAKSIGWPTIIEYFTKRGRPLDQEEINLLIEEDEREAEEYKQR